MTVGASIADMLVTALCGAALPKVPVPACLPGCLGTCHDSSGLVGKRGRAVIGGME